MRVLGVHIIDKGLGVRGVSLKHVPVPGKGQTRLQSAGKVGGFLKGHVADTVAAVAPAVASVDGKERHIEGSECKQLWEHALVAQRVPGMVDADAAA